MRNLWLKKALPAKILAAVLVCVAVFITGCGRIDVNLHTTVKTNGDIVQEVKYTSSGAIGNLLGSSMNPSDLEAQGWVVETTQSGDSSVVTAAKTFKKGEGFSLLGNGSDSSPAVKDVKFTVNNYLIFRNYHIEGTLEAIPAGALADYDTASLSPQVIDSMFSLAWAVTLPGSITSTNADHKDGNTATWDFTYSSLQHDKSLTVDSRYIAWPVILAIFAALVVVAVVIVLILVFRKKKPLIASAPEKMG